MSATTLKRALMALKYKGVFEQINGLLIGRNAVVDSEEQPLSSEQAMLDVVSNLPIPVIYDMDISHLPPNLTLVNGAIAHVDGDKDQITQVLD